MVVKSLRKASKALAFDERDEGVRGVLMLHLLTVCSNMVSMQILKTFFYTS